MLFQSKYLESGSFIEQVVTLKCLNNRCLLLKFLQNIGIIFLHLKRIDFEPFLQLVRSFKQGSPFTKLSRSFIMQA